ncbi:hypothetical protein [uncultured Olegusella sp.]|uniref:hypothetical protein n=1 Tax=uncultured Olegusella sp. TaxID=1979846 RepID=UPI00262EE45F|nr:hypothetical protein [uncultured Olegusella sp.]
MANKNYSPIRATRGASVPAILETLLGIVLICLAAWRLGADQSLAPGFIATVCYVALLLVGVALTYLGVERRRDAKHLAGDNKEQRH